jgi:hypothetical protein
MIHNEIFVIISAVSYSLSLVIGWFTFDVPTFPGMRRIITRHSSTGHGNVNATLGHILAESRASLSLQDRVTELHYYLNKPHNQPFFGIQKREYLSNQWLDFSQNLNWGKLRGPNKK